MKTTGWYSGKQKPVRAGWYEIKGNAFKGMTWMDWWDGTRWRPTKTAAPFRGQDNNAWRGLTKEMK